jgi:crotonobetainyl-CoA:carnitine CoA-transferase CaiB-like acyl-CoA transferase
MSLPLKGIRVIDLAPLLPGALAAQILGDLGAEVIKVEAPGHGDWIRAVPPLVGSMGALFALLNRNKRSVTIDLRQERGVDLVLRLAATADVLIEGFRPGVLARRGLGEERLRAANPRLIICSISGFGQSGPWRGRAGHDINYQALAGIVGLSREEESGRPLLPGVQVADIGGGTWPAVAGILAALFGRERGGGGETIDISMSDGAALFGLVEYAFSACDGAAAERATAREGGAGDAGAGIAAGALRGGLATYGIYRCADGGYLALGILGIVEPKFWSNFLAVIGHPEWAGHDPASPALRRELEACLLRRPRAEWMALFSQRDHCVTPVLTPCEAAKDPQMAARSVFYSLLDEGGRALPAIATPIRFRGASHEELPRPPGRVPPALGNATAEILAELGVREEERTVLATSGVI